MPILQGRSLQEKRGRTIKVDCVLALTNRNSDKKTMEIISEDQLIYKALPILEQVSRNHSVKPESHKRKRTIVVKDEADSDAMIRAKEIQANLSSEFPIMIKSMMPSHVSGGFWLGLCQEFCNKHMPKEDTMFVLEDESGKTSTTRFLAGKVGLSAGWRGFSIAHKLKEGDVLVFHMVEARKFKVYIVRTNSLEVVDGALGLLKLDGCVKKGNPHHAKKRVKVKDEKEHQNLEPILLDNPEENNEQKHKQLSDSNLGSILDHSENESEDLGLEITDGIRLSESVIDFKEVKSFEDFDIVANGLLINCELSKDFQLKYYKLCCHQNCFLHDQLVKGLNCKLIAGMLAEAINIADAIKASNLTISQDDFAIWKQTLKCFQGLGMKVDFLLSRLQKLVDVSAKLHRYEKAKVERNNAEEEVRALQAKLLKAEETVHVLDFEIATLEMDNQNLELMFDEVARAPW